ncbi:MAG: right-handed parallel beta-helix repeat-containing protein [Thermoplasmata archaeon]|nr:MAG: right-handed parallel beta-helix repeat-containing protein [Thermoplasmata archaeon]
MIKRIVAVWLCIAVMLSASVVIMDITLQVKGDIIYVGTIPENDTDSIQDAIDNFAISGDTVYVYSGTYYENVVVDKTIDLIGEDMNTTIIDGGLTAEAVKITADGVYFSGFTMQNAGPSLGTPNLFVLSDHNTITGNIMSSVGSTGIRLEFARWNNIVGNNVSSNSWRGMYLYYADDNNITDNTLYSNGLWGISLSHSDRCNITGNTAASNNDIGIYLSLSTDTKVSGNTLVGDGIYIYGLLVNQWNTHEIDTSNTVNDKPVQYWKNQTSGVVPQDAGQVILANCSGVVVENQDFTDNYAGVQLGFSFKNIIKGNNISDLDRGVYLYSSNYNNFTGNSIFSNDYYGIILTNSDGNNITGNNISESGRALTLTDSNGNNITNNLIFQNGLYGISLSSADRNNISRNDIVSNPGAGIVIEGAANGNTVTNNTVSSNDHGIAIDDSADNKIYHNNIIGNDLQASDNSNNLNQWDNGYPSGGNFWSDYSGADQLSGPDQDLPGSDGIGDTNHSIDGDSWDLYPLMEPVGNYTYLPGGWNLISIPLIQSNTNLDIVLFSIRGSYDAVQWYNVTDQTDHWKTNHSSKPIELHDLHNIDHLMGFWLHISEPGGVLFNCSGAKPTENQAIPLYPGWNMVGYPSLDNKTRDEALNNLTFGSHVDSIWTYNAAAQTWEEVMVVDSFFPGKGYWIHATQECEWEVPL